MLRTCSRHAIIPSCSRLLTSQYSCQGCQKGSSLKPMGMILMTMKITSNLMLVGRVEMPCKWMELLMKHEECFRLSIASASIALLSELSLVTLGTSERAVTCTNLQQHMQYATLLCVCVVCVCVVCVCVCVCCVCVWCVCVVYVCLLGQRTCSGIGIINAYLC